MPQRKSRTCKGTTSEGALTEYDTEPEAAESAAYVKKKHKRALVPYACGRCQKWHLAPIGRQTPSTTCESCLGADRLPKESYSTKEGAEKRARIIRAEQGVALQTYACPRGNGWHLTRDKFS
jgi:hypothetical protein